MILVVHILKLTQIPQMKQIFTDCCNEMKIYLQCTSFFQNLPFALCPLPFALCPLQNGTII